MAIRLQTKPSNRMYVETEFGGERESRPWFPGAVDYGHVVALDPKNERVLEEHPRVIYTHPNGDYIMTGTVDEVGQLAVQLMKAYEQGVEEAPEGDTNEALQDGRRDALNDCNVYLTKILNEYGNDGVSSTQFDGSKPPSDLICDLEALHTRVDDDGF